MAQRMRRFRLEFGRKCRGSCLDFQPVGATLGQQALKHNGYQNMKSKQLANVLIKILGLSVCTQSVMHFLNGIFNILAASRIQILGVNFLSGAILAVIGIFLIVKSQVIAGLLFKNEED